MPIVKQSPPQPTQRATEILALAKEALQGADEVRSRTRLSIEAATNCGRLLLAEQKHVLQAFGRKSWESYFEITFSKALPMRTAYRWMSMAKQEKLTGAGCHKPAMAVDRAQPEPNQLRTGMIALGIFPAKTHVPTAEAGDTTIPSPRLSSHLSIINRFVPTWDSWWESELNHGLSTERAKLLLADCQPIIDRITKLAEASR